MQWEIVVVTLVPLIGAFVTWSIQKAAERRDRERLRRESLYTALMEGIGILHSAGSGAQLVIESQIAWLYASDDVLKALAGYRKVLVEYKDHLSCLSDEESASLHKAGAQIHLAIRKDLCPKTGMTDTWMEEEWVWMGSPTASVEEYVRQRREKR